MEIFNEKFPNLKIHNEGQIKLIHDVRNKPYQYGFKIEIDMDNKSNFCKKVKSELHDKGRNSVYDIIMITQLIFSQLTQEKIFPIHKYTYIVADKTDKIRVFQYTSSLDQIDKLPQAISIADDFLDFLPSLVAEEAIRVEDVHNLNIEARKHYEIDESIPKGFIELFKSKKLVYFINEVYPITKNKISLEVDPFNENEIKVGSTKIGGMPDLPNSDIWPEEDGVKLSFIMQINLRDTSEYDKDNLLPNEGLLLFFYDNLNQPWHSNGKGLKVLHIRNSDLTRMVLPNGLSESDVFKEVVLNIKSNYSFPLSDEMYFLSDKEEDNYYKLVEGKPEKETYLLGHPIQIQNDVLEENQQTYPEQTSNSNDWILLLQVDSEYEAKMMWGDGGRLYFLIHKEDLAREEFNKVRVLLQCY